MHELSIAYQLVEAADRAARLEGATRVTAVFLRLGALAGVVRESLEFAWDLATADSLLQGAQLVVEPVPLCARCPRCDDIVEPRDPPILRCPHCGDYTSEVVSGRELQLRALDIERGPRAEASPTSPMPR